MSDSQLFGDQIEMKMPTTQTKDEQQQDSELPQQEQEQDEDEEDQEEFSFMCLDPDNTSSPISADDLFSDGQIRPLYPLFNQALIFGDDHQSTSPHPLLRKIFIENPPRSSCLSEEETEENTPTGTFCEWSGKSPIASPDRCKKSNSTGFSKLWRFRDLLHRSSSDGKDTFVFLHPPVPTHKKNQQVVMESQSSEASSSTAVKVSDEGSSVVLKGKAKLKGAKTSEKPVSAHERHYMRNRVLKEEEKRRSYLPYKVGFFTSASGLSKNVHPF